MDTIMIEISLCKRDLKGNKTNEKISKKSDKGYEIWKFFEQNAGRPKRKRKAKKKK